MNCNVVIRQGAFKTCTTQENYESKDSGWQPSDKIANTLTGLFIRKIMILDIAKPKALEKLILSPFLNTFCIWAGKLCRGSKTCLSL